MLMGMGEAMADAGDDADDFGWIDGQSVRRMEQGLSGDEVNLGLGLTSDVVPGEITQHEQNFGVANPPRALRFDVSGRPALHGYTVK